MCVFPFHYLRSAEQQRSLLGPKADGNRYEDIAAAENSVIEYLLHRTTVVHLRIRRQTVPMRLDSRSAL